MLGNERIGDRILLNAWLKHDKIKVLDLLAECPGAAKGLEPNINKEGRVKEGKKVKVKSILLVAEDGCF